MMQLLESLQAVSPLNLADEWHDKYNTFLQKGSNKNATFALHVDMMMHAIDIIGISLAERIGGSDGYCFLQSCMKNSLLFCYLNGASSYAAYTTSLLVDHALAPPLVQEIKKEYFSVPYGDSCVNYGLDTYREEDHRVCKKFFRPGGNVIATTKQMLPVDEVSELQDSRAECLISHKAKVKQDHDNWKITDIDIKYILRVASLIVRRGGLSLDENSRPINIYSNTYPAI